MLVLTEEWAKKKIKEKGEEAYCDLMVLDTTQLNYHEDKVKFEWGVAILDIINKAAWANRTYEDLGSSIKIDYSILNEVITSIFNSCSFNDEQLIRYFNFSIEFQKFSNALEKWKSVDNHMPYELEYTLFGVPFNMAISSRLIKEDVISDSYGDLYCDLRFENIKVNDFLVKAKEMMLEITKESGK